MLFKAIILVQLSFVFTKRDEVSVVNALSLKDVDNFVTATTICGLFVADAA